MSLRRGKGDKCPRRQAGGVETLLLAPRLMPQVPSCVLRTWLALAQS